MTRHPFYAPKLTLVLSSIVLVVCGRLWSQSPSDPLLSQSGPTFVVTEKQLNKPVSLITYGDQRFTDPSNTDATDPRVRQWLVSRIGVEKPDAVVLNGDVPLAGNVKNDYAVYREETQPWRAAKLRVYPALGNHEFHGNTEECLENWWTAFPEMRGRRWYSVALGKRIYVIALDSDTSLLPGSPQTSWLDGQVSGLPDSVDFVLITMHHPPVADFQKHLEVSHNPRPNEIALRDYLSHAAQQSHAQFLVSAGHIHNYERATYEGVTYLVSGGGGAHPYFVERTPEDQYRSVLFPNYHYVKLTLDGRTLRGVMYRVVNPEAETLAVEVKDTFVIEAKPR